MESEFDINQIKLPKWPALVVKGKKISREQAAEVIIRTDGLDITTNDREYELFLSELIYGTKSIDIISFYMKNYNLDFHGACVETSKHKKTNFGILDIYYLKNQRIVSTLFTGPHGWCDWAGQIQTNTYNIGKYPEPQGILDEWKTIAETFPFLDLKCQLMSGEVSENLVYPVIEYRVKNGGVKAFKPNGLLETPRFPDELFHKKNSGTDPLNPRGERGCKPEYLIEAMDYVKRKMKIERDIKSNKIWEKIG